jgi:catechol 2,3-dioxygenase-like lactoylglutathione lyase family enzyme
VAVPDPNLPDLNLRSIVLDAPDVRALADFYERLLGWRVTSADDDPTWRRLQPADGGTGIAIQHEPSYVRPTWPAEAGHQQIQLHLDFLVEDVPAACAHAERCGAVLAAWQPDDEVRVYLDPVGHPFCLFDH